MSSALCCAVLCSLGAAQQSTPPLPAHLPTPFLHPFPPPSCTPPPHRYPQLLQALMMRFGGHPYDEMDLLPFNVVDPVKRTPLENLWGMGYNRNELVRGGVGHSGVGSGGRGSLCVCVPCCSEGILNRCIACVHGSTSSTSSHAQQHVFLYGVLYKHPCPCAVPCCAVLCVLQPPELHPYNFPELMIAPLSPLTEHDHQVGDMLRLFTYNW